MANERPVEYEDPDVSGLHIELFESDSNLIGISAVKLGDMNGRDEMQLLTNIEQEFHGAMDQWAHYAALGGAGQYSLERDIPSGVLAFVSKHNRSPNENEINWDVDEFRAGKEYAKNVVGKSAVLVPPEDQHKPIVKINEEPRLYEGPPRLWQVSFITRAYSGSMPESLTTFAKELEAYKDRMEEFIEERPLEFPTDQRTVPVGYIIFHATEGDILYQACATSETYDPRNFQEVGSVQTVGRRLFYIPQGSQDRVDLSELRLRDQ